MIKNTWTNTTGPDSIGRAEGVMLYIPASDGGMLLYLGGVQDSFGNGTYLPQPMDVRGHRQVQEPRLMSARKSYYTILQTNAGTHKLLRAQCLKIAGGSALALLGRKINLHTISTCMEVCPSPHKEDLVSTTFTFCRCPHSLGSNGICFSRSMGKHR